MSNLEWSLIGGGIWVFVSVTFPMVFAIVGRAAGETLDEDDARLLIGLSWLWPALVPLGCIVAVVTGIIWCVMRVVNKYTSLIMGKPVKAPPEVVQGKVTNLNRQGQK